MEEGVPAVSNLRKEIYILFCHFLEMLSAFPHKDILGILTSFIDYTGDSAWRIA